MNKFMQHLVFLICISSLVACVSSQTSHSTRYYLLDASVQAQAPKKGAVLIKVNSVVLPQYLSTSKLVMLGDDSALIPANFHLWADSLDSAIHRSIKEDLNQQSKTLQFVNACNTCDELSLNIEHFYPTINGKIRLIGSFSLGTQIQDQAFFIEEEIDESGYSAAVKKMRESIRKLSTQILMQMNLGDELGLRSAG